MEWALFWIGVNFLIGYAIGRPKGQAGISAFVCVLLGPIGWIIAALSKGDTRPCPFCAEMVRSGAAVCKHCHRELPRAEEARTTPQPRAGSVVMLCLAILLIAIAGFVWIGPGKNWMIPPEPHNTAAFTSPRAPTSTPSVPIGSYVSVNRALRVNIPPGEVIIPAGDRVKLLSTQGLTANIDYNGYAVAVPAADLKLSR